MSSSLRRDISTPPSSVWSVRFTGIDITRFLIPPPFAVPCSYFLSPLIGSFLTLSEIILMEFFFRTIGAPVPSLICPLSFVHTFLVGPQSPRPLTPQGPRGPRRRYCFDSCWHMLLWKVFSTMTVAVDFDSVQPYADRFFVTFSPLPPVLFFITMLMSCS